MEVATTVFIGDALGVEGMSRVLSLLLALAMLAMGTRAMGWFRPNCFLQEQKKTDYRKKSLPSIMVVLYLNPSSMVSLRV